MTKLQVEFARLFLLLERKSRGLVKRIDSLVHAFKFILAKLKLADGILWSQSKCNLIPIVIPS